MLMNLLFSLEEVGPNSSQCFGTDAAQCLIEVRGQSSPYFEVTSVIAAIAVHALLAQLHQGWKVGKDWALRCSGPIHRH